MYSPQTRFLLTMLFTTSWDDGHALDFTVRDVLARHSAKGTFYLCKSGYDNAPLSREQILSLGETMEIGAHTLTHPSLPDLTPQKQHEEIRGSKMWLEELLGKECTMFAYPYGRSNTSSRDAVIAAGFLGARTTRDYSWEASDPFLLPTSVQLHPFPFRPVMNRRFLQPIQRHWGSLRECGVPLLACRSWLAMSKALFLRAVETKKPWFHLWGHSWSTEQYGLWNDLEAFLAFVNTFGVTHVPNSALIKRI